MKNNTQNIGTNTRVAAIALGISNILSFVLGVSIAGRVTTELTERRVSARPAIASAAGIAALFGRETAPKPPLPIEGKGMWIYEYRKLWGGNARTIVNYAKRKGLTHLFIRSGSSIVGTNGWPDIAKALPIAHAAGIKVIAWDFPYLRNVNADVRRARWVLGSRARGHKVDGFAADVETRSEGTVLTRHRARLYATRLRANSGGAFLLLVPPRPNRFTVSFYPYDVLMPHFDAVAPMVYWGSQEPASATSWAMNYLRRWNKPIAPIGQSYDMGPWGGPKGPPAGREVVRFMNEAKKKDAVGVSFWSWQHTPTRLWHTIHSYQWPDKGRRT